MSDAEMRKALENAKRIIKGDFQDAPDENEVEKAVLEQIDEALESEITTAELVSELRKRDSVEEFSISLGGYSEIKCSNVQIKPFVNFGKATILRITDLTEVKK